MSNSSSMFVQPFAQFTPVFPREETLNLSGFLHVMQSTVSPLPTFFMMLRWSLNEFAEILFICEKSNLVMIALMRCIREKLPNDTRKFLKLIN